MSKSVNNESIIDDVELNNETTSCGSETDECANMSEQECCATDIMSDDVSESCEKTSDEQIAEWRDKYMRLQAEFDNYRKRTLKEKMGLIESGGSDVLKSMADIHDDFQRAVDAMGKSDDIEALRAGITLISNKFTDTLKQKGVVEIDVKGKDFDSDLSEAIARFDAGEDNKGKVIDVVQTGYMLHGKVLRFAKVVVGE